MTHGTLAGAILMRNEGERGHLIAVTQGVSLGSHGISRASRWLTWLPGIRVLSWRTPAEVPFRGQGEGWGAPSGMGYPVGVMPIGGLTGGVMEP